jgi:hypothetical protein
MDRKRDRREDAPDRPQGEPAPPTLAGHPLLALQHAAGNRAVAGLLARHPVATTAIHRLTQLELFGDGTPANLGATLAEFEASTYSQADWFVEPTLTDADRDALWALLRRTTQGPQVLAGTGDLRLAELRGVSAADWTALEAFGRCCHSGSSTVRVLRPAAYTLAQRVALGTTLTALEAVIPADVLRLTVSEVQLSDVQAGALVPAISAYWATFHPHLQRHYDPAPGARGLEFQAVLDLLTGPGTAPFASLLGRIRNLHRFSIPMLTRLVANFNDHTRARPVDLVLHTSHDESSFMESAHLFADLVLNSPNLVLFLEGQEHLTDITAMIPQIATDYGQDDGTGTFRLHQAMIAGHGQTRGVELAGTGAPTVSDGNVHYPHANEGLDLDTNLTNTQDLLDALLRSLDPATARVVFAGCLVGAQRVAPGTNAAGIQAQVNAGNTSLAAFTQQRATAAGLGGGIVQGARASVALGAATSLQDGGGNLAIQYSFDPNAFGGAAAYVASGHEPEGLMRAAVELAVTDPVVAANTLRTRLGQPVTAGWYDEATLAMVRISLEGVGVGAGVDLVRLNELANLSEIPFLARWPGSFSITVGHFGHLNAAGPLGDRVYAEIAATPTFTAPPDDDARVMRLLNEEGRLAKGDARDAALLAFLDATPQLTAELIQRNLDAVAIAGRSPTLFPAAAPATTGRIRLALAWLHAAPANADVRAFLDGQVVTPGATPELSAAVRAELGGFQEAEVLETLGRRLPTSPAVGGGASLPNANAELRHTGDNRVLIEPNPYEATVLPHALNVRSLPGMHGTPFAWVHRGDVLSVAGFTHDWAGIDIDGRLGFVYRHEITPP